MNKEFKEHRGVLDISQGGYGTISENNWCFHVLSEYHIIQTHVYVQEQQFWVLVRSLRSL